MLQFLLRKFLRVLTVLLGVTLIMFLLMHAIPGNPWSNYSNSPRMLLGMDLDKTLQRAALPSFRVGSAFMAPVYPLYHRRL